MPPTVHSRYEFCTGVRDAVNRLYLTPRVKFEYAVFDDTIEHHVREGDTWHSIAALYYHGLDPRPARFFWAVCDFQLPPIVDPTIPPEPGSTVYVPSLRTMREEILHTKRRRLF